MASSISTELQAIFDFIQTDKGIAFAQDIDKHFGTPFYRLKFGTLVKGLVDVAEVLDAAYQAQLGTPPNWGPGVADIAALKAVAIANRTDKQSRVVEANGLGGESIYIFDSASTLDGDDVNVVVPTLGTGRWILAVQNSTQQLPVINKTGGPLTKGTPCYISGWDTTAGKLKVAAADAVDGTKPADGILGANLADNAQGVLLCDETSIASSGLNTSGGGVTVGDPVYLASGGGMTLTIPVTGYVQIVARVQTKAASGTVRVAVEPMRIPPAADADKPGLLSAADWAKLNKSANPLTYGNGSDGVLAFDGIATPVAGATLVGAVYTATRDIHGAGITIGAGVTLKMAGFRLFDTGTTTLGANAIIANNGGNGGNAADITPGAAGAATGAGTLAASQAGLIGKDANAGANGNNGNAATASLGGAGGTGGAANGGLTGGVAGAATALTAAQGSLGASPWVDAQEARAGHHFTTQFTGGASGGSGPGGAGAAGPNHGGGGGGSGGGGGPLVACLRTLVGPASAKFQANGGNGGNGGAAAGTGDGGGGGAGGGGGFVLVVTNNSTGWLGSLEAVKGAPGTGGVAAGTGVNGSGALNDAVNGKTALIQIAY